MNTFIYISNTFPSCLFYYHAVFKIMLWRHTIEIKLILTTLHLLELSQITSSVKDSEFKSDRTYRDWFWNVSINLYDALISKTNVIFKKEHHYVLHVHAWRHGWYVLFNVIFCMFVHTSETTRVCHLFSLPCLRYHIYFVKIFHNLKNLRVYLL